MNESHHRKIIHIDMDAFFASVEQRDNPALRGKPVAVGGSKERGVVAAASYEARQYGVRSAMSSRIAYQKCPHIIFVKHRFDVYKRVSRQIREIFSDYTELIEPLSLDEAFLDVTENKKNIESAIKIAADIRRSIFEETQLTASAGVSINKFLAKIASDLQKPNGLSVILPNQVHDFLDELPIKKFFGVGEKTAAKMEKMGLYQGKDLKKLSKVQLADQFGKFGLYLFDMVRGIDNRPVKPNRIRKSISNERTFDKDLITKEEVDTQLDYLVDKLVKDCSKYDIKGKTVTIKYRYSDFTTFTKSKTLGSYFNERSVIIDLVNELSSDIISEDQGIRLLGVGLSSLNKGEKFIQLQFNFNEEE